MNELFNFSNFGLIDRYTIVTYDTHSHIGETKVELDQLQRSGDRLSMSGLIDPKWFLYHDIFNMAALPLVFGPNVLYLLDFGNERFYYLQYTIFLIYIVVDTIWLTLRPKSVPKASTILWHHYLCIAGWNIPIFAEFEYAKWVSLGVLVEINTFLLISRRNVPRTWIHEFLFYATWLGIRLGVYHVALVALLWKYAHIYQETGKIFNTCLIVLGFLLFLNTLNIKWSIDLYNKTVAVKAKNQSFLLS